MRGIDQRISMAPGTETRQERVEQLYERLLRDTLTVPEAREFIRYIEEELARAKASDQLQRAAQLHLARRGVESYIWFREQGAVRA